MSDVINPLLFGSLPQLLPENLNYIQISDLPPEILLQLKTGATAVLEVTKNPSGVFSAILKTANQNLNITLPDNILQALSSAKSSEFSVRIGTGGRLFPLAETVSPTVNPPVTLPDSVSWQNILEGVEVAPLKIKNFIEQSFEQLNVPQNVRDKIIEWITPLSVSLIKVGESNVPNNMVSALQNIISKIAAEPQNAEMLKTELFQAVQNLTGTQISGQVTERVNDLTVVQTPLGKTFFESKLKLPLAENILLNIGAPVSDVLSDIKIMDSLLKILLPPHKDTIKTEMQVKVQNLKNLAEINTLKPEIMPQIIRALPVQNENILENMYRFYQGAIKEDAQQWLGKKTITELGADTTGKAVIKELNNFLVNAVKETPVWKIVEMPLFDGRVFSPLKIAVKKEPEKEQQKSQNQKNGTRFIVETEFSKLGGFQFDGFSSVERRSLDLIIRTTKQLDDDFCSNVINLFKKSLYNLDYAGTVKINRRQTFINLYDENQINSGIYI